MPSASIRYPLLAVSHVLEVLVVQYLLADLMLVVEGLRPCGFADDRRESRRRTKEIVKSLVNRGLLENVRVKW